MVRGLRTEPYTEKIDQIPDWTFVIAPHSRVAVVGAGVAGLTAAWLLSRRYDVDLFEQNDYTGGHTRTIEIEEGPDAGTPVDTGFIVLNNRNYPLFVQLLDDLGVERRDSDMSFSFACEGSGYAYSGRNLRSLFARPSNAFRADHWRMIADVLRFNKRSTDELSTGLINGDTLGEYIRRHRFSKAFADNYLLAMGSAIWSSTRRETLLFPAEAFIRFFHNHGLLRITDRPQWQYVYGGSRRYVQAMRETMSTQVHLSCGVRKVRRAPDGVYVHDRAGAVRAFDRVVIATHADEALALLENPTREERSALGAWRYQENEAVLHTDPSVMPRSRHAWAAWNFTREGATAPESPISVTYYMNRLQRLETRGRYFVSLNRTGRIAEDCIIDRTVFTHPVYTFESMRSQERLPDLNRQGDVFFCGSYFGYGFHEDAVRSAFDAAEALGVSHPRGRRADETRMAAGADTC
jgi:predicted NAD/FAD-binding protein